MDIARQIDRDRLLQTFTELININSPSFDERRIGDVLAAKLRNVGFTVEIQEYDRSFNLLAFKKGGAHCASPLLLSGHMDTIEPTEGLEFKIQDDIIRSTGNTVLGADDKSALAQILEALAVLHENNLPHGDIEVVFTSGEEKGLCGAKNLDFAKLRSRHALVLDSGGSVGNLVVAAPAHNTYEMQITGRAAHAGIEPEKGINAIKVASRIISGVPDGRIDPVTTANIGMIKGGTATNVVAKEVVVHGELRSHDPAVLESTRKAIFGTAQRIAEEAQAGLAITEHEEYMAFKISEHEPFMKFLSGVFRQCGIGPAYVVTGGGSDANIFNQHGIMAVNLSTGMQKVHSTEEFIEIKDLYNGCLVVLSTILNFRIWGGEEHHVK